MLPHVPGRGRIIIVDFEMGGAAIPPEMNKSGRPCLVVQNNKLYRGRLVTVVCLSATPPKVVMPYHYQMSAASFADYPEKNDGEGPPRWAKCDYITTVSLDRCLNPHYREPYQARTYVSVRATKEDVAEVEERVLWALGFLPDGEEE